MTNESQPKLVAIYGSPRRNGNTDTLLDAAAKAAEDTAAAVQRLYLRDMNFGPCQNCGYCRRTGACRLKDDMAAVYDALEHSDIILLAAPIYFCSLCAQAKAMIDRCQPYWSRKYILKTAPLVRPGSAPQAPRPVRGGFISCGGFKDDRFLACTEQIVKTWYYVMGVAYQGNCFVPGLDAAGDAAKHPAATQLALDYGKNLVLNIPKRTEEQ